MTTGFVPDSWPLRSVMEIIDRKKIEKSYPVQEPLHFHWNSNIKHLYDREKNGCVSNREKPVEYGRV